MKKQKDTGNRGFSLEKPHEQLHSKDRFVDRAADVLFLWIFLCGMTGAAVSMFRLQVYLPVVLLGNLPIAAGMVQIAVADKKKIQLWGILGWCAGVLLFGAALQTVLGGGINLLLNQGMDTLGSYFPYMMLPYTVQVTAGYEAATATAALLWCALLIALPGIYLVRAGNTILSGILFVFALLVQVLLGFAPSLFWNGLLFFSLLLLWIRGHGVRISGGRQRLGQIGIGMELLLVCVVVFVLLQIVLPVSGYKKNSTVAGWREKVAAAVQQYRYGGSSDVLPEGEFQGLGSWVTSDKAVLQITMSSPQSYYLRGFTGADYTGTGWESLASENRWKGRDLFYWLHTDGFFGQESLALAASALDSQGPALEKNAITVENINGSSKYMYVPYELYTSAEQSTGLLTDGQKIGDEGVTGAGIGGSRSYTYEALDERVTRYASFAAALSSPDTLTQDGQTYQKLEGYYNQFVYDNYLEIPDTLQLSLKNILGSYKELQGAKHADYAEAKQNILYVLQADCTYTETQEVPWTGTDLVQDFLTKSQSGYSVQFASTAAMMFRYYKIPARYVEGYLVTPADVENMTANEAYTLDETHAHTWVEYYQDGVGWLPFETTPAYMNVMNQPDQTQDISGVSDGASQGQSVDEEEEQEEEEQQEEPQIIDWILVLEIVLIVLIALFVLALIAVIIWIIVQRQKSRQAKKLFHSKDNREAVCAIFSYTMNLLSAVGLRIRNTSLYRYEKPVSRMFDEQTGEAYHKIVQIRQKAVYSQHEITDDEKRELLVFQEQVWERIHAHTNGIQKLQLKFIYFL